MEAAISKSRRYTIQEYFRLAEASATKLEFKAGQIIDMAGATYNHNRITANILRKVGNRIEGGPCEATGGDTRVQSMDDRYCYPDVTIVSGGPVFDPLDSETTITNPQVIFEVLSPSTEVTDRGEKFFRYIRIPSMKEYFLVAQESARIESFIRQTDGSWKVGDVFEGLDSQLLIKSLDLMVPLQEIYANAIFPTDSTT